MDWSTSSETVRVLNELIRLNAATASACYCAAARQRDLRLWRCLLDAADESFHFVNSLLDQVARFGPSNELWCDWTPAAPAARFAGDGLDGDAVASLGRQMQRKLAAYDQAINEPIDRETRRLLRRQRAATAAARRRLHAASSPTLHAEAA